MGIQKKLILAFSILMLLSMFCIDSIGLSPGVYYYYNILTWGLIGLFYRRDSVFYTKMFYPQPERVSR